MRSIKYLLCLCAVFAGWNWPASAQEDVRVFTNNSGKKIEASLLEVRDKMAVIRRVSDGREFEFSIGSLSLDDQIWIVEWVKKRDQIASGGWANLRVELVNPTDGISVVGLSSGSLDTRVGARQYQFLIPLGAWIRVSIRSATDPGELVEHLVQFKGARRWKFTEENRLLLLSRDAGQEKIVGITLPSEDPDRFLRTIEKSRLADEVCVELVGSNAIDELDRAGINAVAFTSDTTMSSSTISDWADENPKAVYLSCRADAVDSLQEFEPLEALGVTLSTTSRIVNGVRETDPVDDVSLSSLPAVRDLHLSNISFSEELGADIIKKGVLRMLEFLVYSSSSTQRSPVKWDGIDQLSGSLESLRISSGIHVNASEVERLKGLKGLKLSSTVFAGSNVGDFDLSGIGQLLMLDINTSSVEARDLEKWAESGALSELRKLHAPFLFDTSEVPKLETARFWYNSTSNPGGRINIAKDIGSLSDLKSLSISGIDQGDIEALAQLASRNKIEKLRLENGTYRDLSPLASLTNLRLLELYRHEGGFSELDLSAFPTLRSLYVYSMPDLETIKGIPAHPNLLAVRLNGNDRLDQLGSPAENRTLRLLEFYRCPALRDLSAFGQFKGLTELRISGCDGLSEPLDDWLKNNPLNYLSVSNCENLNDRSYRDL